MKKSFLKLALAVLTIGLLGSCSKINERLDNLEKEVSGIENEQIASINTQITNINSSIADLGQIRSDISSLKQSAENHGQEIFALQEADETLGNRIVNLETYLDEVLPTFAETEWVEATFSTLEQYEETCDAIAEIDAKIGTTSEKLSKDIKACADSLTKWVNKTFEGYYTAAEMDAKLAQMKAAVDSAKASGGITDAKADSIAAELAKTKTAVDTAKANIRAEYRAAIDTAIKASEGKLTKALQDAIATVNGKIESLTTRVGKLETSVADLTGRIIALEKMIQTVAIVPEYNDGSVKVDDKDSLYIDFIVSPASAIANLAKGNVTVLVNKVKTKAFAGVDSIKIGAGDLFEKDAAKGTVSVRVSVAGKIPAAVDSTITIAVNVKNGISDFTTEFVPVYVAGPALPKGALAGEFSVSADKKVHFSKGNLTYNVSTTTWAFYEHQYDCATGYDSNLISLFTWGYDATKSIVPNGKYYVEGHSTDGESFSKAEDWGYVFGGESSVWRTLTKDEWVYLFNTRTMTNSKARYSNAVDGVTIGSTTYKGVFLYPDNYNGEVVSSSMTWDAINAAGIVFLPAAGYRDGSNVRYVGDGGYYWSSTDFSSDFAYCVVFSSSKVNPGNQGRCSLGCSVRLITESK